MRIKVIRWIPGEEVQTNAAFSAAMAVFKQAGLSPTQAREIHLHQYHDAYDALSLGKEHRRTVWLGTTWEAALAAANATMPKGATCTIET